MRSAFFLLCFKQGEGSFFCRISAMNDAVKNNGLTNCEDLNVYNELVHKKWR